jgi:hypothetical protein
MIMCNVQKMQKKDNFCFLDSYSNAEFLNVLYKNTVCKTNLQVADRFKQCYFSKIPEHSDKIRLVGGHADARKERFWNNILACVLRKNFWNGALAHSVTKIPLGLSYISKAVSYPNTRT